jgi:peptidoglycan-N-acetylglucosamine deacetylase
MRAWFVALIVATLFGASGWVMADAPTSLGLGAPFEPGRILRGESTHRVLHFTFDDGPDPRWTPVLLDDLDKLGIKATFFFSASRFADKSARNAKARDLALEVLRRGHTVGSHSVEHKRMSIMTPAQLADQLDRSDRLFTEIFGKRTHLFRPPWGLHNPEMDRMFVERGDTMLLWNIGSNDWTIQDTDKLHATFMRSLDFVERTKGVRGGIVLMHDTHPWTIEAFPRIVTDLRARNCKLLSTSEELYDIHNDLELFREPQEPAAMAALEQRLAERQRALREHEKIRCAKAP